MIFGRRPGLVHGLTVNSSARRAVPTVCRRCAIYAACLLNDGARDAHPNDSGPFASPNGTFAADAAPFSITQLAGLRESYLRASWISRGWSGRVGSVDFGGGCFKAAFAMEERVVHSCGIGKGCGVNQWF